MFYQIDKMINVCGLICPEPIILVRKGLRCISEGRIILVLADDFSINRDVVLLCRFMGHSLVMQVTKSIPYCFLLKKGFSFSG